MSRELEIRNSGNEKDEEREYKIIEMMRLNAETTQAMVASIQGVNNEVANIKQRTEEDRRVIGEALKDIEALKYRAPIRGHQKLMLRNAVGSYVYKTLGDKATRGRVTRAYKMGYKALRPYGYTGMDSTEIGRFDEIMEATKHALTFTLDEILEREREDREREERNLS